MIAEKNDIAYNPSAIVHIFNNALNNDSTRKIVRTKGVYIAGKGVSYNGFFFDQLKDEASDACITLIVPAVIRTSLVQQQTIECLAFLTKKVQLNGAKIELQLNMVELLAQNKAKYSEEQIQSFRILQRKADAGYKDVESYLKTKIIHGEPVKILILIGKSAIIDSDIKHQLEEAISFYDFRFVKINLNSENEIIEALKTYHTETHLLVISRGGGENISIFNKPSIAEAALTLNTHFITAIGHKEDNSLLQQVADKSFITPTALGQYFNDLYNRTMEELQNSKAKLIDDITKQLQANYDKQIKNLEDQIKAKEAFHLKTNESIEVLYRKELSLLKEQATTITLHYQQQIEELNRVNEEKIKLANKQSASGRLLIHWILIGVAMITGILLGKGCN